MLNRFSLLKVGIALGVMLAGAIPRSTTASTPARVATANKLTAMPEAVTSFGAVTADGWLYVFGGHKGERHEYDADKVSGAFHRLRLDQGGAWEKLPDSAPGQGLPLVTHDGRIYRLGGMAARNPAGTKQDLHSTTLVQQYDPKRGTWEDFAPLPAPRSSHDAVVLGNKLYLMGGWQLFGGTNKPVWPDHAMVLDFDRPQAGWKKFPQPFQRRAVALAAVGSRIYCIGGMDSDNQSTLAVEIFDTASGAWSKGPDLPPGKHKGFSCSAIAQGGRIYASAFQGDLLRLATNERSWEVVGRLRHPRMSHRLVATEAGPLLALGGEDGEEKRPDLELLIPSAQPRSAAQPNPPSGTTSATAAQ